MSFEKKSGKILDIFKPMNSSKIEKKLKKYQVKSHINLNFPVWTKKIEIYI